MLMMRRSMDCSRQLLLYAVYDVLDRLQSSYEVNNAGGLSARICIFDNVSGFDIQVLQQPGSSVLCIDIPEPAPLLTEDGMKRTINFLLDSISQHLENEGVIKQTGGTDHEAM